MSDIMERLLAPYDWNKPCNALCREAADEIERLWAENARLRGDVMVAYTKEMEQLRAGISEALQDRNAHFQRAERACAEIERLKAALRTIETTCTEEINARFSHPSKSADEIGAKSAVYHLLVVPRNIARAALEGKP